MATLLALESSCDETAVAIVRGESGCATEVLASVISSQIELHREHGGVVPELASRNHSLRLQGLVEETLKQAGVLMDDIDAFAATSGPGLASSLLIGSTAAKGMACALDKPFLAINHMEGHLLSPFMEKSEIPPHLTLIVSGGHTLLIDVQGAGQYTKLGSTRDDAAGEAYDKIARRLELGYPGGPVIDRLAAEGNPKAFDFPRPMIDKPHAEVSFSGLKSSVIRTIDRVEQEASTAELPVADLCASFQQAVVDVLVSKTLRLARQEKLHRIALAGGVAMNRQLRAALQAGAEERGMKTFLPQPKLCVDNGAMVAGAAYFLWRQRGEASSLSIDARANAPLGELGEKYKHATKYEA